MGYNITSHSVKVVEPTLIQLLESKADIFFKSAHPRRLANKLRQGIVAAKSLPEFKQYSKLHLMYSFKEVSGGVIAEFIGIHSGISLGPDVSQGNMEGLPELDGEKKESDSSGFLEILSETLSLRQGEIYFPLADLTERQKGKIHEWTQDRSWQFIDQGDRGITMTTLRVPEEAVFSPYDGEEEE